MAGPDIPEVIETARRAGLVNLGGQLQFRLPDGGTCECYWVEVNTYGAVSTAMPWDERVARTADAALADFARLKALYDFLAEGRRNFGAQLKKIEERGGDPAEAMCFAWYVLDSDAPALPDRRQAG